MQRQEAMEEKVNKESEHNADQQIDKEGLAPESARSEREQQGRSQDETAAKSDGAYQPRQRYPNPSDGAPIGGLGLQFIGFSEGANQMSCGEQDQESGNEVGRGVRTNPILGPNAHGAGVPNRNRRYGEKGHTDNDVEAVK